MTDVPPVARGNSNSFVMEKERERIKAARKETQKRTDLMKERR